MLLPLLALCSAKHPLAAPPLVYAPPRLSAPPGVRPSVADAVCISQMLTLLLLALGVNRQVRCGDNRRQARVAKHPEPPQQVCRSEAVRRMGRHADSHCLWLPTCRPADLPAATCSCCCRMLWGSWQLGMCGCLPACPDCPPFSLMCCCRAFFDACDAIWINYTWKEGTPALVKQEVGGQLGTVWAPLPAITCHQQTEPNPASAFPDPASLPAARRVLPYRPAAGLVMSLWALTALGEAPMAAAASAVTLRSRPAWSRGFQVLWRGAQCGAQRSGRSKGSTGDTFAAPRLLPCFGCTVSVSAALLQPPCLPPAGRTRGIAGHLPPPAGARGMPASGAASGAPGGQEGLGGLPLMPPPQGLPAAVAWCGGCRCVPTSRLAAAAPCSSRGGRCRPAPGTI